MLLQWFRYVWGREDYCISYQQNPERHAQSIFYYPRLARSLKRNHVFPLHAQHLLLWLFCTCNSDDDDDDVVRPALVIPPNLRPCPTRLALGGTWWEGTLQLVFGIYRKRRHVTEVEFAHLAASLPGRAAELRWTRRDLPKDSKVFVKSRPDLR